MTHRARISIHGTGRLSYVSAHTNTTDVSGTANPYVAASFTYADHDVTLFLEPDREILAEIAAQFRVLADRIDQASDAMMADRLRSSLLEVEQ